MALRCRVKVERLALLAPVIGLDPPVAQAYRDMIAAVRVGAFDPRPTSLDRMASPGFAERDPARRGADSFMARENLALPRYVCGHVDTGALHLRRSLASSNAGSYSACR
jgi:hypothetical protein